MTTIVGDAREGVLVADSRITDGDLKWSTAEKIERIDGSLFGFAGDVAEMEKMRAWFRKGRAGKKPKVKDFYAIELGQSGLLTWDQTTTEGCSPLRPYHAIGTGAHAALAAMMMGADPTKAVEIACLIDASSEGPIRVMRLADGA